MDDTEFSKVVVTALDLGERLIDAASLYRNEVGVGQGPFRIQIRSEVLSRTTQPRLRGSLTDPLGNAQRRQVHRCVARHDRTP
jgi:hypothetical protein